MSNFQFLYPEFKPLLDPARGAEQLIHSDARACCMRTRFALEQAVHWLYTNDRDLRMPYDRSLNALLVNIDIEKLLPPTILQKARLIQKLGNQAVHSNQFIGPGDAQKLVRELFHVLYWLARTYTRASDPKSIEATFDERRIPKLVRADEAVELTRKELAQQEAQFHREIAAQHKALEDSEAKIAEAAATLAEREAMLAKVDAELVAVRAELAKAKAKNVAAPDVHDYNEADTRTFFIDVLLREAGWEIGKNAVIEMPVTGMRNESGAGAADYVLMGANGKPLAVVEAKRTMKDDLAGQQQAKLYADCLEQMTGQRPVIFYGNGHHTYLWDDYRGSAGLLQPRGTRAVYPAAQPADRPAPAADQSRDG
jgi:type I restriction enzyme, R subunit